MTPDLSTLTVSLDTARALKDAVWDRPTALVWRERFLSGDAFVQVADLLTAHGSRIVAPAPTLGELLDALPLNVNVGALGWYDLNVSRAGVTDDGDGVRMPAWARYANDEVRCAPASGDRILSAEDDESTAEAAARLWLIMKAAGHIPVE